MFYPHLCFSSDDEAPQSRTWRQKRGRRLQGRQAGQGHPDPAPRFLPQPGIEGHPGPTFPFLPRQDACFIKIFLVVISSVAIDGSTFLQRTFAHSALREKWQMLKKNTPTYLA